MSPSANASLPPPSRFLCGFLLVLSITGTRLESLEKGDVRREQELNLVSWKRLEEG